MKRDAVLLVLFALAYCLASASTVCAQAKGSYHANPFTGTIGGKIGYWNPMKGIYRPEVYYNPWTGRDVVDKSYYNPYTGASGAKIGQYNPFTGNHFGYTK